MMNLLLGAWGKVLAIGAVVGAVLLAILKIRQSGRDAERVDQARRDAAARSDANEADRMVDRAGDGELDELRRKWTRPR